MIGERLAELRKLNGEKQQVLAKALSVSVSTVRSWEHDKSSPDHSTLVAICRRYHTSSDFLLGLSDYDPSDKDRRRTERDAPLRRISVVETQKISRPARP